MYYGNYNILVKIEQPNKIKFDPEKDPECHQRNLNVSRGIYLIHEWWEDRGVKLNFDISDDHGYQINDLEELRELTLELHHEVAPWQKVDDSMLIFGTGATQILNAALFAVHAHKNAGKLKKQALYLTHQRPGYYEHILQADLCHPGRYRWVDPEFIESVDLEYLLECVTSPNNPDGKIAKKMTNARYHLYDRVNHWDLFMHENFNDYMTETLEDDLISVFSHSKILSFSGSRVGYAFVRDQEILKYMRFFVTYNTHGVCIDGQVRCAKALEYLLRNQLFSEYTEWIQDKLEQRWKQFSHLIEQTEIKLLNSAGPAAWVKTPWNAQEYLSDNYNVFATYGPEYGATENYARISMLCSTNEFNELIWRITEKSAQLKAA
ncbi:MAG: hypothetical protein Tsb0021_17120 [Chlamydiales bacterium]